MIEEALTEFRLHIIGRMLHNSNHFFTFAFTNSTIHFKLMKQHFISAVFLVLSGILTAQEKPALTDLSFWKPTQAKNWQIAGSVSADLRKNETMKASGGTGVLVNLPDDKNRANLLSVAEYGDVEVSFDFMMAKHSNSGFYLQGRYEVQLLDSWGHQQPTYGDCGGVYARRRWNPNEQMFDGHAPRLNACLAPGLWQHLDISFQAPRFDASGNKIANARLLKVMLNGYIVQENIELTGPTGGPISEKEAAKGPFMIQGDHGPVAFRNFSITDKGGEPVKGGPFNYKVIYGDFRYPEDFANKKVEKTGISDKLTWEVAGKENGYAIIFNGKMSSPRAGKHRIVLQAGGKTILRVNGQEIMPDRWTYVADQRTAEVELAAGQWEIELTNYKMDGWMTPYLGLWVEGPGSRASEFHSMGSALSLVASDPIELDANTPVIFRSFMDITMPNSVRGEMNFMNYDDPHRKRVVHAVQVGDPAKLHYTYDLDNGSVAQIWKGGFLNTSPMWDDRGDGSSRPRGPVLALDDIQTIVPKTGLFDMKSSEQDPVSGYKPTGYNIDAEGYPVFRYILTSSGTEVQDQISVVNGESLVRTLTFGSADAAKSYFVRLATGRSIEKVDDGVWVIDDKRYYVQTKADARVETAQGISVLYVVPASEKVEWQVHW
ncbi:MAG: hypothetical protein RJA20_2161 [Bacteroidota bacterium]